MPENDISVIDFERGLSFMPQHSWKDEHTADLNNGYYFKQRKKKIHERGIQEVKQDTQSVLNDTSTNPDTKISGTVDDYRNLTLSRQASNFVENVGFQGVRYIFMRDAFWLRRLMWIAIFLSASGYCLKYRLNEEQLRMLEDMYKPFTHFENETGKDPERYDHINMKELMINSSFEYFLNVGLCFYKGRPCDFDLMYTEMRDIGLCLTFDPSRTNNESMKYQILPGKDGGISFATSVYENNWTPGPFMNYDGLVILVHDPSLEVVLLENHGTTVAIGHTTNVILKRKEVNILSKPYGQCGSKQLKFHDEYTEEACRLECNTENLIKICGCREPYMPGNDSVKYCNNVNLKNCENIRGTGQLIDISCDCPPKCNSIQYDVESMVTKITEGTRSYVIQNYNGFDLHTTGALINVYYSELSYKTETQEATYTLEKLLCDVGGAGGLFLGASFMSFFEVADFLFYVFYLVSAKLWKKSKSSKINSES